ncbi:MAG: glycosyltransferase [Candidatus Pacearchaeota archaeon]
MKKQKIVFLYEGPHPVHAAWAKAVGAKFIADLDPGPKLGKSWLKRFFNAFRRLFILNRIPKDTDVLLLEGGLGFIVGFLFKKFRKGKVIMICSDPLFKILRENKLLGKIGYYMTKNFDGFIATSKLMFNFIPFKNKEIVYPFAYTERFSKIKVNINSKNIIYVGIINKQKGVDRIVKIFFQIQKKIPEAKLFLVGEGPLKEKIKAINNEAIVLTGFIKNPERYMSKCAIYINLSRLDPFGVGVIEAMAAGLVPIISENVGAKDIVEKIDKSLIVKDEEEATKKIIELFRNKKKLKALSIKVKKMGIKQNKKNSIKAFKRAFFNFVKNKKIKLFF